MCTSGFPEGGGPKKTDVPPSVVFWGASCRSSWVCGEKAKMGRVGFRSRAEGGGGDHIARHPGLPCACGSALLLSEVWPQVWVALSHPLSLFAF